MEQKLPLISVIIPVYNVEKYLKKCIDSVINQTYTNLEIILVSDTSPDNCEKICDDYAEKDSRIKVIHKEKNGLSAARNAGIDIASGKYIGFVDSDDYIALDMYELLYKNILKENADISACGFYDCFINRIPKKNKPQYIVVEKEKAIHEALVGDVRVNAWNKLYKSEIFDDIRYPVGKIAEDAFIIIDILMKCRKVVYTSEQKYYYCRRENSLSAAASPAGSFGNIEAYRKNYDKINLNFPNLRAEALSAKCVAYFSTLDKIINFNDKNLYIKEEKEITDFLRKNSFFLIFKAPVSLKRKVATLALLMGKPVYKIVIKFKKYK